MKISKIPYTYAGTILLLCIALLQCAGDPQPLASGSGNNTGNAAVKGTIQQADETPAGNVQLSLLPGNYNPAVDTFTVLVDTTDSLGRYAFSSVPPGTYTISASADAAALRWFRPDVQTAPDETVEVNTGTLLSTRTGVFPLPIDSADGYAYVPGLDIIGKVDDTRSNVTLENMPRGAFDSLVFCRNHIPQTKLVVARDIKVAADSTFFTPSEHFYKHSGTITLNTTPSGADVSETVYSFPVLIRFNNENFDFSQVREDGGDLYFAKKDGTPIPFEIEQWIEQYSTGAVWVLMDTLAGGSEQSIRMYWGNPGIDSMSRPAEVFDTANGFASVWHLEEYLPGSDGAPEFEDATYNVNHGRDYVSGGGQLGLIAYGQDFNGPNDHIDANPIALRQGGSTVEFTFSCWFNIDRHAQSTLTTQYFMELIDTASGTPHRQIYATNKSVAGNTRTPISFSIRTESGDETVTGELDSEASIPHWRYVVVSVTGREVTIYQNGVVSQQVTLEDSPLASNSHTVLRIGRNDATTNDTKGSIDEVRVSSKARSGAWIKLCFQNQRPQNTLVTF